jgi:choice-of-anchor B domain-containing protein
MRNFILHILLMLTGCFLHAQQNMDLLGYLPTNSKINDIWGYTDTLGNEYALVGSEVSLYIIDVSAPQSPVLLFEIFGDTSVWRDIKTFDGFAYVTNEEGGGLLIVDLRSLPNSAPSLSINQIDTFDYQTAHNIFIDENGVGYLLGSNISNQGAFIIDLNTPNRYAPNFLGLYDDQYVHDAYVRDDTLYTAEISNGTFSVVDVGDKEAPIVIARQSTSRFFTHNCWLSDDGNYLATTDEKPGAYVDMYDISDLNNIRLTDQFQNSPGDSVIPHNTFFLGDYLYTSYYRNGLSLVDATLKDNLVEVGSFDTSPFSSDDGFEGNWGVYPFLPSGNILISDREEGLFIIAPSYTRASYLIGSVFDTLNNNPVNNAQIDILGESYLKYSQFDGSYHIGVSESGFYDIRMSHPQCQTVIETNIELETALEKVLNFNTLCDFTSSILDFEGETSLNIQAFKENNTVVISYASKYNVERISLLSLYGQVIKEWAIHDNSASIYLRDELPAGLYFVRAKTESQEIVKSFIKH